MNVNAFSRAAKPARAFTLIELLVVIAILGILMAALLPALGSARESSRIAFCQNSLNQIGKGLEMYADANKGFLPKPGSDSLAKNWAVRLAEYLSDTNLYVCPSDSGAKPGTDRTYAANGVRSGAEACPFTDGKFDEPMRLADLDNNQGDIILVGERPRAGNSGTRGRMDNDEVVTMDLEPGAVHRGESAGNYLMGSGACKLIRVGDAKKISPGSKGNLWTLYTSED